MSMFSLLSCPLGTIKDARTAPYTAMTTKPPRTLKTLRRQIDETDDKLHSLLMQRAALVAEVGVAKQEARARRSAGARGRDPAPPVRTPSRQSAGWRAGASLARAHGRGHHFAGGFLGRGCRAGQRPRHLGFGARPLRQSGADGGLSLAE